MDFWSTTADEFIVGSDFEECTCPCMSSVSSGGDCIATSLIYTSDDTV